MATTPDGPPAAPAGPSPGATAAATAVALRAAADCFEAAAPERTGPYSGASPEQLAAIAAAVEPFPEDGQELVTVLDGLGRLAVRHAVDPAHPACAAHLHCQPLAAAVAADVLASATNPSLDSWDQAPIATHLERRLIDALTARAGYDPGKADGVVTNGGTQSNLMGLLLARDGAERRRGRDAAADGLGPDASLYRVLCSELGRRAVEPVAVDGGQRLDLGALDRALDRLEGAGLAPLALVATAGTTDFGSVDPLAGVAERARDRGLWLHVDAAYGGALLFSDRHRGLLDGIAEADSVSLDFHKLLWQPIACGAFLVRDAATLAALDVHVPYLNPDEPAGSPAGWRMQHLVGRSLATTRRFDALKVLISFRALGRRAIGERVDRTLTLAAHAGGLVDAEPTLALAHPPGLGSVVFRYLSARDHPARSDRLNDAIRLRLLAAGEAVIGRTEVAGRTHLKLTLLNPDTAETDLAKLVASVVRTGAELDRD
jgi:L-2,4-diaminobutyrate decarboxylase